MSLEILTSDLLDPVRHGFFTRRGGVSQGIYKGLNCGHGSDDQTDAVTQNRALVADAMGVRPDYLASVHQTHSADVLVLDGAAPLPRPKADAMVTATPGVALGILTADCQPVLLSDPKARVIGAAHAGWKGSVIGVLKATVRAMESLGANRRQIRAVIGPSISQRAYEVGPAFFDTVTGANSEFQRFFIQGDGDRLMFDLPSFGLSQLRAAGVDQVEWTGHCTYSDPARFFSYRRTTHAKEPDYGRLISVITL